MGRLIEEKEDVAPQNGESMPQEEITEDQFTTTSKNNSEIGFAKGLQSTPASNIYEVLGHKKIQDRLYSSDIKLVGNKQLVVTDNSEEEIFYKLSEVGDIFKFGRFYDIFPESGSLLEVFPRVREDRTELNVEIYCSDIDSIKYYEKLFEDLFKKVEIIFCNLSWYMIDGIGRVNQEEFTEKLDDEIVQESYPFIQTEDIDQYIKEYVNGDESVLLLMGSVGTGKTRLIRYLLKLMSLNSGYSLETDIFGNNTGSRLEVIYTTDAQVLNCDEMFLHLTRVRNSVLVLEDIDFHLQDKSKDNPLMYKILASSDGLIKNNNKIIISTNLESEKHIDSALIRPGRCYDIVRARNLSLDEANNVLSKLGSDYFLSSDDGNEFNLSEVYKLFNSSKLVKQEDIQSRKGLGRRVGF